MKPTEAKMSPQFKKLLEGGYGKIKKLDALEKNKSRIQNREQLRQQRKEELKKLMEKDKKPMLSIEEIAKQNNINLFLGVEEELNSGFCSKGNSLCNAEIYIGKCDNKEIETAIFFHELGHIFQSRDNYSFPHQFHYELDAWMNGLQIGYKYGYFIDPNVFFEIAIPALKAYKSNGTEYMTNETEKTAVEQFIEQLEEKGDARETPSIRNIQFNIDTSEYLELKRQAIEMEKEQNKITEETSDGYHTFKTLYQIRKAYNVTLFNEWGTQIINEKKLGGAIVSSVKYNVHKSRRHHDGEYPFGKDNWFIVSAMLPTGQISNHYTIEDWDLFKIPETEKALFPFDGHSTEDVIERLLKLEIPHLLKKTSIH
jgi:hypothetical protein